MLHLFYKILAVIILILLFFVAGGGISQNDRFKIEKVVVEGTNESDQNKIRELAQERLKGNYFFIYARENSYLFPRKEIQKDIQGYFPRLKSAQVRKVDEHTLLVSVVERKPFALWCGDEFLPTSTLASCWFIDDTGFIFDRAPVFSPGVYFEIYGKRENEEQEAILRSLLPPERFSLALAFIQELQRDQIIPLRLFMKPEGEYGIVVNSSENYPVLRGVELLFKDEQNASTLLKNLSFAIPAQFPLGSTTKKKLHYIDLRFGNKVFFGFEK